MIAVLIQMRARQKTHKYRALHMHTLKAGVLYFILVFGTGFALGMIRVPLLVPRLGERYAELLEMPFMLLAIVLAARYVVHRFALPAALSVRLAVGFAALALLVAAELLLAAVLGDRSIGEYIAGRDPVSGAVYLVMLFIFALMPAILARRREGGLPSDRGGA